MAPRSSKNKIVARIVTGKKVPCGFCQREVDDELTYGKLYAIGDIQCHYFCVLLSSCLVQKVKDEDGLFGFIYEDIIAEIERAKKHRCSYCSRGGANLGCSVSQCRKQFHLPCGRERNAVSLFFGNYKSFCQLHAPKQSIPASIMIKAKQRKIRDTKTKKNSACLKDLKELSASIDGDEGTKTDTQSVCVICYEAVEGYPTLTTFWPPCCARDAWFHRSCLQRMALSAGMHYLKCPLCNDKENFYEAVVTQGYYVPDRDAAWELEQNAFSEIYDREVPCSATECLCPMGRTHDADQGSWCVKLCLLCGSSGAHAACLPDNAELHVCVVCMPAAPQQIEQLASCLQAVINQEQEQASTRTRRGPVMPSRMSLRRTKRHVNYHNVPSCSSSAYNTTNVAEVRSQTPTTNTASSRHDLNLKTPKKPLNEIVSNTNILEQTIDNISQSYKSENIDKTQSPRVSDSKNHLQSKFLDFKTDSPSKLLEESLRNKLGCSDVVIDDELVEELRRKFRKPKPLCEKRKIVNDILNGVFDNLLKEPKLKEPVKQWCSPKKCDMQEIIEIIDVTPPSKSEEDNTKTPIMQQENIENCLTTPNKSSETALRPQYKVEINYPIFDTPKNLKTVDILKDSSLEISAKDEIINIDVIKLDNTLNNEFLKGLELKSPEKTKKCAFKFSPSNKDILDAENIDIDMESFKDQYLNEVGLQRVVRISKENKPEEPTKTKSRKRKLNAKKIVLKYEAKKHKTERKNTLMKDKNIKVKIKWRIEQLRLKISDSKKKMNKRKHVKQETSADNLIQTSIDKFFKIKTPSED